MPGSIVVRSGLLAAAALAALGAPDAALAAPVASDFHLQYYVTDEDGERSRVLSDLERRRYMNQARCECGHKLSAGLALNPGASFDLSMAITTLVGTMCDVAEVNQPGQFLRCAQLSVSPLAVYAGDGLSLAFHPVWLSNGTVPGSPTRDPNNLSAIAAGSCRDVQGQAGVYMCAQTNNAAGCQADEFFMRPGDPDDPAQPDPVVYDFLPPLARPSDLAVEATDTGAELSWSLTTIADIHGFRVLCEEVETGEPAAGANPPKPSLDALVDGTLYYNAHNLCGDAPFSTAMMADAPAGEGGCGDGFVDDGEECDDGEDNRDAGLCSPTCELNVSAGLHALDWSYICSEHLAYDAKSAQIEGLEPGKTYNLVLVAYDAFGNPLVAPEVVQVSMAGSDGGSEVEPPDVGCECRSDSGGGGLSGLALVALGLAGVRRRRRG